MNFTVQEAHLLAMAMHLFMDETPGDLDDKSYNFRKALDEKMYRFEVDVCLAPGDPDRVVLQSTEAPPS